MKPSMPLLAALFICLFFIQCDCNKEADKPRPDNPYGLPNATQTGVGFLACRINGTNFIGERKFPLAVGAQFNGDTLYIDGEPENIKYFQILGFAITNISENKIYNIDSSHNLAAYSTDSTCKGISFNIIDSYSKTGTLQITKYDTLNKIVSGTFTGLTFPTVDCETLDITDGRFDYYYN